MPTMFMACEHVSQEHQPSSHCVYRALLYRVDSSGLLQKVYFNSVYNNIYKSSSGDEIPERDVMYHLICLLIYH